MFTGIIEALGEIVAIRKEQENIHFEISSPISAQLRIDQSLAHDGVCLTVIALGEGTHTVTAVYETLQKTNLALWEKGRKVNLERAMRLEDRLDGHLVQGHVDITAVCAAIHDEEGSWRFVFKWQKAPPKLLVPKGSVCVNGVSLTVADLQETSFSVAIIPYTFNHTNFSTVKIGEIVNVEFDIIGKYVEMLSEVYIKKDIN
ncbi:MAG: riboflavin synthase [Chitinophagales bacterium]|nr:riboflavin synthase [Bacteroidota bacterium]MCB9042309.1 riboflavin synthase [Chitinophagales bacterium]